MTPRLNDLHTRREIALTTLHQARRSGIGYREAYLTYERVINLIVAEWSRQDRQTNKETAQ